MGLIARTVRGKFTQPGWILTSEGEWIRTHNHNYAIGVELYLFLLPDQNGFWKVECVNGV